MSESETDIFHGKSLPSLVIFKLLNRNSSLKTLDQRSEISGEENICLFSTQTARGI